MLKDPQSIAVQTLRHANGDLELTSFALSDYRKGIECMGPRADPQIGFGVVLNPRIDPRRVEELVVERFRESGHAGVARLLEELDKLVADGAVSPKDNSTEPAPIFPQGAPWRSLEKEEQGHHPAPLDEGLEIHGAAFGRKDEVVGVPGAKLFRVPSAVVRWVGPWLAERLHVAQDRCPALTPALYNAFEGLSRRFVDAVETYHVVQGEGDQEQQSLAREVILEGLPELYKRIEEALLPCDIGQNLKERILRAIQEKPARLVHYYGTFQGKAPELPETERDLRGALQNRPGAHVRAFWTEPSKLASTRQQNEACGELVAPQTNLKFSSIEEAISSLTEARRTGRCDLTKTIRACEHDRPFAHRTLAEQAASYEPFVGLSHEIVRPYSPIAVPEWVRPARIVSPSLDSRQIEYDFHQVEQGYRTSIWRWPAAFFFLSGRPTTLWNEVRFHTKVHDSLGAVFPGFVVSRWMSGTDEKGRALKWGEVLTSLPAGCEECASLRKQGGDLREYSDGSVWVGMEQKKSFHDVNERIRRAFQEGNMSAHEALQHQLGLARQVNALIHHDHLAHRCADSHSQAHIRKEVV